MIRRLLTPAKRGPSGCACRRGLEDPSRTRRPPGTMSRNRGDRDVDRRQRVDRSRRSRSCRLRQPRAAVAMRRPQEGLVRPRHLPGTPPTSSGDATQPAGSWTPCSAIARPSTWSADSRPSSGLRSWTRESDGGGQDHALEARSFAYAGGGVAPGSGDTAEPRPPVVTAGSRTPAEGQPTALRPSRPSRPGAGGSDPPADASPTTAACEAPAGEVRMPSPAGPPVPRPRRSAPPRRCSSAAPARPQRWSAAVAGPGHLRRTGP
jgi:hypothetical protein